MQMLREAVVTKDGQPHGEFVGFIPSATLANCSGPESVRSVMTACASHLKLSIEQLTPMQSLCLLQGSWSCG